MTALVPRVPMPRCQLGHRRPAVGRRIASRGAASYCRNIRRVRHGRFNIAARIEQQAREFVFTCGRIRTVGKGGEELVACTQRIEITASVVAHCPLSFLAVD